MVSGQSGEHLLIDIFQKGKYFSLTYQVIIPIFTENWNIIKVGFDKEFIST